jgi:hypothetical protein
MKSEAARILSERSPGTGPDCGLAEMCGEQVDDVKFCAGCLIERGSHCGSCAAHEEER